jgi:hypothetical protein
MFVVPPATPLRTPVLNPIVATAVLLLVQVPPLTPSLIVSVPPAHSVTPLSAVGCAATVTAFVAIQPSVNEYVTLAMPAEVPVKLPEPSIVAFTSTLHVPPPLTSPSAIVEPEHTMLLPDIAAGFAFTVTACVDLQPPPTI